jgi:prepilin-type processing-associated H-X9-DG protein
METFATFSHRPPSKKHNKQFREGRNMKKLLSALLIASMLMLCASALAEAYVYITGSANVHYGYNYWHLGAHRYTYMKVDSTCWPSGTHNKTANVSALDNPSGTVCVADSVRLDVTPNTGTYWLNSEYKASGSSAHIVGPRHGANRDYNVAWADGHATTQLGDGVHANIYKAGQLNVYTQEPNAWTTSGMSYAKDR